MLTLEPVEPVHGRDQARSGKGLEFCARAFDWTYMNETGVRPDGLGPHSGKKNNPPGHIALQLACETLKD